MKRTNLFRTTLLAGGAIVALSGAARAEFTPIPLDPSNFNYDPVIEQAAPVALNSAVNVTMDGGTNKTGDTWYERGYNPAAPTTGIPVAGSQVSNAALDHTYVMPPDYHVNNVIMVGHSAGGQTPLLASGTLTLTTPAAYTSLSFLNSCGNGPVTVGYRIHYADSSTEENTFVSTDWFNGAANVFNAAGRVRIDNANGVENVNGSPAGAVFAADVLVGNPSVNITSIDFFYSGSGATPNPYNNGRAVIFAVSGSTDNVTFTPVPVTGFNYDAVVEADGPPARNTGVAAVGVLTNHVSVTMDGGVTESGSTWFEKGYYSTVPSTGLPAAGSTVTSAWYSAKYIMPANYAANCSIFLLQTSNANISLSTPAPYGALSLLCGAGGGNSFVPYVVSFTDGTTESGTLYIPDWFNRELPYAYTAFGRVEPTARTINNAADQFVNPFTLPYPFQQDFRGLGLPVPRLFDAVINLTNTVGAVSNISLTLTNTGNNRNVSIFALSGAAPGNVPPIFGARGSAVPGQPANAPLNAVQQVKTYEGTNTVILSVTNIAGTAINYQWMKAPRGGGLNNIYYTWDYTPFANVVDGGRISGATTSALVISNASLADSADYLVVASNPYGSATSMVATVMILTTNQSALVGVPAGDVLTPIASDSSPGAESIDHAIDRVAQKWLSDGIQWSGACCGGPVPFTGPVGFVVTPVSGASIVTSMRFYTANDSSGRDPMDYSLEGSNDGATWTPITGGRLIGTLSLPTGRNGTGATPVNPLTQNVTEVDFANATGYKSFRVSITNNYARYNNALMQIAEIELLGTPVANPPVWVQQPLPNVQVYAGTAPSFTVSATGYPVPKYQWYRGATLIPGATDSTYTLSNAQLSDSGATFSCVASNIFGQISSSSASLSVIAAPTQPYPVAVLADSPLGYWRLNETPDNGTGNNGVLTHDYAGGHNGSYTNATVALPGYNPTADPDTSAQFGVLAAADSYVANINGVDFARATNAASGGKFSVEAWVYGGNQTASGAIVTKGYNGILTVGTGTGTEQFVLDVTGNSPSMFRFLVRDAAGNGYVAQSTAVPFDPASAAPTWRHLVGVCDQPNGKVYLYVDGILAASGDIPANVGILSQPLPMTIGARKSSGASGYDNQWQGVIDDVAAYNTSLSAGQILNHFLAGQRPPVIVLQPVSQTKPENVSVTFASSAYGAGNLAYQWYQSDGSNPTTVVPGQTSSNLTFTTSAAQSGNYYQLVVSSQYGATTGTVAQLTVVGGAPTFAVDLPATSTYLIGHLIQLKVEVLGTAPFTYQWQKDGQNINDNYRISGSKTNVLTIGYITTADTGNYQVIVTGVGSSASTMNAVAVITSTSSAPALNASGTGWTMQGTPSAPIMSANRLELTSGLGNTARSAFTSQPIGIASFNASFVYQTVSGAGGADGATFCIQNAPAGPAAIGGGGGAMAYGTITPSVALALNIYDPNTRGIRLLQNGTVTTPFWPIAPVLIGGNTDPVQINLNYAGGVLTASFRDTVTSATYTTNFTVDIPTIVGAGSAYLGFTGADGGVSSTQVITDFTMSPPPVLVKSQVVGNSLVLSWPSSTGAFLKSTPSLTSPVWTDVTAPIKVVGSEIQVTITPLTGNQYYRLDVYP